MKPICPDCRCGIQLEKIDVYYTGDDMPTTRVLVADPYYNCPRCNTEFAVEDVDE